MSEGSGGLNPSTAFFLTMYDIVGMILIYKVGVKICFLILFIVIM